MSQKNKENMTQKNKLNHFSGYKGEPINVFSMLYILNSGTNKMPSKYGRILETMKCINVFE